MKKNLIKEISLVCILKFEKNSIELTKNGIENIEKTVQELLEGEFESPYENINMNSPFLVDYIDIKNIDDEWTEV